MANFEISVSNIAWLPEQDFEVSKYLKHAGIHAIEIAPTRYFPDLDKATKEDFTNLRAHWNGLGIHISSMQSLLFNRPDLQLFGHPRSRAQLTNLLLKLSDFADILGAGPMVFGSPKNRSRNGLDIEKAKYMARLFFTILDASWKNEGTFIAFEANPEVYGCNFITRTSEALEFVNSLSLKNMRWHFDLACTELAGESPIDLISEATNLPSHIHISESNLLPLSEEKTELYSNFFSILKNRDYRGFVTLEMRNTEDLDDLENSIRIMSKALDS